MFGLDAIVAIGGLLLPPVVDFVKKKWLKKEQDTPEATMSTLATTKPDVLPGYVTAVTGWLQAQVSFFNRDVTGTPSQWVVNLRAAIRPVGVCLSFLILIAMVWTSLLGWKPDPSMADTLTGVRLASEAMVSSWFGDRLSIVK
jgi:hypothetical protein